MCHSTTIKALTVYTRSHRERKATYAKALEQEVAVLRADNAVRTAEALAAASVIRHLQELLRANNITVPPDLQSRLDARIRMARAQLEGDTLETQRLRVRLPADEPVSSSGSSTDVTQSSSYAARSTASSSAPVRDDSIQELDFVPDVTMPTADTHTATPTTLQLGVDFVLALEHICLHHHDSLHYHDPQLTELVDEGATGHAVMLQSPIIYYAPNYLDPITFGCPPEGEWNVPAAELERLLELSHNLDLSNEVTPVQAWQRILAHPHFDDLSSGDLLALCQHLVPSVECYG